MKQDLNQELELLVDFFWRVRKLSFTIEEYPNIVLLEEKEIIKSNGSKYVPLNYNKIAPFFLEYYKNKNAFNYSSDFSQTTSFIKKLKDDFLSQEFVSEFYYIGKEILKNAIIETHQKFKTDFSQYINQLELNGNREEIFEFIEAYNAVISELDMNAEMLYKNAVNLKIFAQSDATYNGPLGSILIGIKNKSEHNENIGIELFQFAIQCEIPDDDIISAIVAGLYSKLGYSFYQQQLMSILTLKNEFKVPVINGLSNINKIEEIEAKLFIEIFDKEKREESLILVITKLLFSVLNTKKDFPDIVKYIPDIFFRINQMVLLGNEKLIYFILHEISFLHKYDSERIGIVKTIIDQPFFTLEKYGSSIEQVFRYLKDIKFLRTILLDIALKCPFKKLTDFISVSSNGFDKKSYDELLIEFISDNKANIRFIGLDIFNHHSLNTGYNFDKNILELSPITQYKLWVGLTQDYKEPKFLIPALIPLLNSKSDFVKEAFICKLEEYAENYGQQVLKKLERFLDKNNGGDMAIIKRIENYMNNYYDQNILLKKDIQELNPYYTHNKLFKNFNRLHQKVFSAKIQKSVEEKSIFSKLAKNVKLGKGGGWKIGGKDEVSKLGHFESSFSMPRSYLIFPNQYEIEESAKMREDWKDEDFELIKEYIDNEQ